MSKKLLRGDGIKFNQQDTMSFLLQEYSKCFDHLKHYDTVQNSLMAFGLTGYIAVFSAIYTIYKSDSDFLLKYWFLAILLLLSSIIGVLILAFFIRNRVYFVIVARQINSIRNYILNNSDLDFYQYNILYIDPDYPKSFSIKSTYFIYIALLSLLNSTLFSAVVMLYLNVLNLCPLQHAIIYGGIICVIVTGIQVFCSILSLKKEG